ncbi:unnamed protein product, partial [Strongylus vulgaris]
LRDEDYADFDSDDESTAIYEVPLNEDEDRKNETNSSSAKLTSSSSERSLFKGIKKKLELTLRGRSEDTPSKTKSAGSSEEMVTNGVTCKECARKDAELKRMQSEIEGLKREVEQLSFESTELGTNLADAETTVYEKDEAIKSVSIITTRNYCW